MGFTWKIAANTWVPKMGFIMFSLDGRMLNHAYVDPMKLSKLPIYLESSGS